MPEYISNQPSAAVEFDTPDPAPFIASVKRIADRLGVEPYVPKVNGFAYVVAGYSLTDLVEALLNRLDETTPGL